MATRNERLAGFNSEADPPESTQVRVLCEDHCGTFMLRFPCIFEDGAWKNAKTGEPLVSTVIAWQLMADRSQDQFVTTASQPVLPM
jgi:hypothetical protein